MKTKDERIIAFQGKVANEALNIFLAIMVIDMFYKSFVMHAPMSSYNIDFVGIVGIPLYMMLRHLSAGNDTLDVKPRTIFAWSMVTAVLVTFCGGIANYAQYGSKYQSVGIGYFVAVIVILFFSDLVLSLIIFLSIYGINKSRQNQIDRKLDKEENN